MVRTVDIVVARYKEDLSWLLNAVKKSAMKGVKNKLEKVNLRLWIYNKGNDLFSFPESKVFSQVHVMSVPNVGRCDETYLQHLHLHYNTIGDTIIFLPASGYMNEARDMKRWRTDAVLSKVLSKGWPACFLLEMRLQMTGFTISNYVCASKTNFTANSDSSVAPAAVRPFGLWYKEHVGGVPWKGWSRAGIFAASRESVQRHDQLMYGRLRALVDKHHNPEDAYFMEQTWMSLLYPGKKHVLLYPNAIYIAGTLAVLAIIVTAVCLGVIATKK